MTRVVALHHVQLAAPPGCEEDARRFFTGLLGLEELPKPASLAGRGGVWFRVGGAQELHVGVEEAFAPARKAHPAFVVADVEALRAQLEAAGVATQDAPPIEGLARFYAADPWGNRIELSAAPRR
jgi:catechol 2,3-dioxygenase-like lactoylglutathione lyase family enzyme